MELHAVQRKLAMLQPHDFTVITFGGDLEGFRQRVPAHDQRMIAGRLQRLRDIFEEAALTVADRGRFPVHQFFGADDFSAEDLRQALMTQANAQDRRTLSQNSNDLGTDPGIFGASWTWRNADAFGTKLRDLDDGDFVIALHGRFDPEFAKILDKIVGKRIVVIDDEQVHGARWRKSLTGDLAERKLETCATYLI
jgi:hypothetical protein